MAALPEDDAPTMTGTPGDRRVDRLPAIEGDDDGDDTTTAEAGPPASRREDPTAGDDAGDPDPHAEEDRTVQQMVEPPVQARIPSPAPRKPVPAAGSPATSASAPSSQPAASAPAAAAGSASPPITETSELESSDITDDLSDDIDIDDDDDESIEDSITATAPRIHASSLMEAAQSAPAGYGLPLSIPGSVLIRSVEHDELLDETEIRTQPGQALLTIPATLRGSPAPPPHGPSQPPPPPRPAAGTPATLSPSTDVDEDDDDDGVTTEAPAPRVGSVPDIGIPLKAVTPASAAPRPADAVPQSAPPATQASARVPRPASPRPAAGMPFHADAVDEPPTRPGVEGAIDAGEELATRPGVEGAGEPATRPGVEGVDEPATRPGLGDSPPRPGKSDPETAKRSDPYANEDDDDDDESVTTRSRAVEPYTEEDESVTTQAPVVPASLVDAALKSPRAILDATLDDGTDGTTQKVKKTREPELSSPADSEAESITTQAPGPLTNILRVIASGSSPDLGSEPKLPVLVEEEPPENRTAVMVNAPLKRIAETALASSLPPIRPTGGPLVHRPQGSAAPQLEPSSESGLRARAGAPERASLGALGVAEGGRNGRSSGVGRAANALASDGSVSAPMDVRAEAGMFNAQAEPSVDDADPGKGPRYGLLVGIVAIISVAVPVTLFFVLHHPAEAVAAGVPSEAVSELEKHDGIRQKGVRGKNGQFTAAPSASAAPSSATSAKPPTGSSRFPFHR